MLLITIRSRYPTTTLFFALQSVVEQIMDKKYTLRTTSELRLPPDSAHEKEPEQALVFPPVGMYRLRTATHRSVAYFHTQSGRKTKPSDTFKSD